VITRTDLEGLDIVLAGVPGPNPGMLLDSPLLGKAIETFRERYDLVLLDTPPLVPVADASGLIPLADGILLVVMSGKTPRPLLARARELCLGMGGHILGLVVGNAEEANPDSYGKGYYQAYVTQPPGKD
jgi:Mrp family chromosome partitioning ATPase